MLCMNFGLTPLKCDSRVKRQEQRQQIGQFQMAKEYKEWRNTINRHGSDELKLKDDEKLQNYRQTRRQRRRRGR